MEIFVECGIPYMPSACPDDLDEEWWQLSYIPMENLDTIRAGELDGASGVSADLAWRLSTGSFDTLISVGDSGIQWEDTALTNKVYVNVGEVPYPQYFDDAGDLVTGDGWDIDGNGLVNVQDWAEDPRVLIDAGVDVADHMLDPSDLIYTFSDGIDDDMNGYIDDISGWDELFDFKQLLDDLFNISPCRIHGNRAFTKHNCISMICRPYFDSDPPHCNDRDYTLTARGISPRNIVGPVTLQSSHEHIICSYSLA